METTTALILIVIGLMAGVFGGIFGIGGAIIMIPAMVYFLGVDQHTAQGTNLAVMLPPIGLFAAYNYYKAGQVNLWYAVIIAVSFMIGGHHGGGQDTSFRGGLGPLLPHPGSANRGSMARRGKALRGRGALQAVSREG